MFCLYQGFSCQTGIIITHYFNTYCISHLNSTKRQWVGNIKKVGFTLAQKRLGVSRNVQFTENQPFFLRRTMHSHTNMACVMIAISGTLKKAIGIQ